eukprot:1127455-Prymnesium_polylepis.2
MTTWKEQQPSVVLSVTGAAATLNLSDKVTSIIERGIADVLKQTNAWLVTGGTDCGVMRLVGKVVQDLPKVQCVCIGVVPCHF